MLVRLTKAEARANLQLWHRRFAWKPTRINDEYIIWLEHYWRKLIVVEEGNWAGGYKYRWAISTTEQNRDAHTWLGPIQGS